ncbi:hypothetical protein SESBI_00195 [Sesbania bispinosa]|nr:hypothetical protein SESBI_00195 [Sesbania bispinosa]
MVRDWANLDPLALSLVLEKLEEPIDHVWFGAVCKSWLSVAKLTHQNHQFRTNVLPMLMIPTISKTVSGFYSIPANKVYPFLFNVHPVERCCGSSHGWLATTMDNNFITLLNPFKNVAPIQLPPLIHDSPPYHKKVTLSADPTTSPNDYAVAVIQNQSGYLYFKSARRNIWSYINIRYSHVTDITFYKGLIYVVNRWKLIVTFKFCDSNDSCHGKMINPSLERWHEDSDCQVYLVKSLEGDLWMVERFMDFHYSSEDAYLHGSLTKSFQVYKLKVDDQSGKFLGMKKLESLGDNVLFVGCGDSISVSASYFSNCLQKDSIYYTSEYDPNRPFVLELYNVKDGSIGRQCAPSSRWMIPSPMWILPQFQWD